MLDDERGQNEATAVVVIVGTTVILSMFFGFVVFQNYTSPGEDVPYVAFDFAYDAGDDRLTITHRSGDSPPGDEVYVVRRSGGDTETRRWGDDGPIHAGDAITLDGVAPDSTVLLVWDRGSEDRSYVIGRWER